MEKLKWFQLTLDGRVAYLNEQLDKLLNAKLELQERKDIKELITTILTWENEQN